MERDETLNRSLICIQAIVASCIGLSTVVKDVILMVLYDVQAGTFVVLVSTHSAEKMALKILANNKVIMDLGT